MNVTVSRPIRIFALVALIAAVGGFAMLTLHKKSQPSAVQVSTTSAPTATTPVRTTPSKPTTHTTPAKTTPARKAPAPVIAANGLPIQLAEALRSHTIVVVSVF